MEFLNEVTQLSCTSLLVGEESRIHSALMEGLEKFKSLKSYLPMNASSYMM